MGQYEILKPACYNQFSCKGGDCRYTCCYGWNIAFDINVRKTLQKEAGVSSDQFYLLDESKKAGNDIYAVTLREDGYCPFLTEDRLCQIQREHGLSPMANICKEFPRIYHRYLNKMEMGLSLGCEKVLELLYEEKEGLQFTNKTETVPGYQRLSSNYDAKTRLKYPALIYYYDIQALCLGLLQAKDASIEDRMILLGMALFHIDSMAEHGEQNQIPAYINQFLNDLESIDSLSQLEEISTDHLGALSTYITTVLHFIQNKNNPDKYCEQLAEKIIAKLNISNKNVTLGKELFTADYKFEFSVDSYRECQENFSSFIKGKEHFLENIAVASIFQFNTPFRRLEQGVWNDYVYFIWIFTIIKFALTVALDENSTETDMINYCAILYRRLGHDSTLYDYIVENSKAGQSNSIAHMAVFLKSC